MDGDPRTLEHVGTQASSSPFVLTSDQSPPNPDSPEHAERRDNLHASDQDAADTGNLDESPSYQLPVNSAIQDFQETASVVHPHARPSSNHQHGKFESFSRSRASTGPMFDISTSSDIPSSTSDTSSPTSHRTHDSGSLNQTFSHSIPRGDGYPEHSGDHPETSSHLEPNRPSTANSLDGPNVWAQHKDPLPSDIPQDGNTDLDPRYLRSTSKEVPQKDNEWSKAIGSGGDSGDIVLDSQEVADEPVQNNTDDPVASPFDGEDDNEWVRELEQPHFDSSEPQQASHLPRVQEAEESDTVHQKTAPGEQGNPASQARDELDFGTGDTAAERGDLEDSWAKAMSGEPGIDDAWGAAFADEFNDGFLEDAPATVQSASSLPQPQPTPAHSDASNRSSSLQQGNNLNSFYHAPPPIQQPPVPQRTTSGGMKFFEDLPMTQTAKVRKPRQPNLPSNPPPGPPPAGTANLTSGPAGPSTSAPYTALRAPERLDPFPPQPTIPPARTPSTAYIFPPHATPQASARYSPAPTQPTPATSKYVATPASAAPPGQPRYSAAQGPQLTPSGVPPTRQAYTPAQSIPTPSSTSTPPQSSYFPPQPPPAATTRAPPRTNPKYAASPSRSPAPPPKDTPPSAAQQSVDTSQMPGAAGPPHSLAGHRFAPRTSSPLAQYEPQDPRPALDRAQTIPLGQQEPEADLSNPRKHSLGRTVYIPPAVPESLPALPNLRSQSSVDLTRYSSHNDERPPPLPKTFEPPRRPRTQSPETTKRNYQLSPRSERSASSQPAPVIPAPFTSSQQPRPIVPRPSSSGDTTFVEPPDPMQASDPLQRWKGCPTIQWNSSGLVTSHFPMRAPRYGGGQAAPAIKSLPGEVKIRKMRDIVPVEENVTSFPGPLKGKSKKKDVLNWLSQRVSALQREQSTSQMVSMDPRVSERVILWQLMQIMVEHDGVLSGNSSVDTAVRPVLSSLAELSATSDEPAVILPDVKSDSVNPQAIGDIRKNLLDGDREKAIWNAVDHRLWGYAMLMASTLSPSVWKQVAQEFIRKEVRSSDDASKSLATLYSTFAGNWDECIDELVPLSARSGFQMMSTADGPDKNQSALVGLDKWQEALTLILNNRSNEDEKSLAALGKLLRGYGRIEAAHVCFLFSRGVSRFGGLDDPETDFSLLATSVTGPFAQATNDLDAILLTEVYEFALSLSGPTMQQYIPHLQAYKLHHAHTLAEYGYRNEALQYCEAIATAIKSNTRLPPYYHPVLVSQLDELNKRLSDSPKDGTSSWMSKPSIGKVSGSMWAKFNNFVSGDDDTASNGSAPHSDGDAGPFAKFTGGTPTISRSPSHVDLYGSSFGSASSIAPGTSRYAPGPISQAPATSANPYQPSTLLSTGPRDSPQLLDHGQGMYGTPPVPGPSFGPAAQPLPPAQPPYPNNGSLYGTPPTQFGGVGVPSGNESPPKTNGHISASAMNGFATGTATFDSQPQSYALSATSYAPTSTYQPYESELAQEIGSPQESRPMRSIMDDGDDDLGARAAPLNQQEGFQKTREPDDAVRRAAEEDGKPHPTPLTSLYMD